MDLFSTMNDDSLKTSFIEEFSLGQTIESAFVLTRVSLRESKNGFFLSMRLGDRSGKIDAVMWNIERSFGETFHEGNLVTLTGKVNEYQNQLQLVVSTMELVRDPSELDPRSFLPASPFPYETLVKQFDTEIKAIQDNDCRTVLEAFRNDEVIWHKFSHAPGAKLWHHPYIHGLLEHTLSVITLAKTIGAHYDGIDVDLLITGAIFHDCGKMDEFVYDYRVDYSTDGRLMGHIFMGAALLERLIARIPDFPEEKRRRLVHMVLSHHGEKDKGAVVVPMTLEACLLHHIENMDAQMAAFQREMSKPEHMEREWTGYVNLIERYLYRGPTV